MYSLDYKKLNISLYNKFKSFRKVSSITNASKSSIHRWFKDKHLIVKNRKRKADKIFSKCVSFIKEKIIKNPLVRAKEIRCNIQELFSITVSLTSIYKILRKLGFTYKKITIQRFNNNINTITEKRIEFIKEITKYNLDDIISIDESYFNLNDIPTYGWSYKGTKCIVNKKIKRNKRSLLLAISNKKIIKFQIYSKNINSKIYKEFLEDIDLENKILLCDNVSFHKTKSVIDFINKKGKVLFTPGYSPEFNPIEFVFSEVKRSIRYENYNNMNNINFILNDRIEAELNLITMEKLSNYFNKSLKF